MEVLDQVVPDLVVLEEVAVELLFSTLQAVLEEEEVVVPLRGRRWCWRCWGRGRRSHHGRQRWRPTRLGRRKT